MIRPPRRSDQSYIASTWARSMLSTHAHQRHMSSRTGLQVGQQIDAVLDRSDTRGLLFARHDAPDIILGWIVYAEGPSAPVVHYLYCRAKDDAGTSLRGRGIATALLKHIGVRHDAGVVCTSLGPSSLALRARYKAAVHVPIEEFLK